MEFIESFENPKISSKLHWHSEPKKWKIVKGQLQISPDPNTDFWQRTHYGFQADNGHFLYTNIQGNFVLETHVICDFSHQYDQAGLMVYVSDQCWVKTSVEFEPNESNKLGVVVTNHGYSDWSTQDVDDSFIDFKLRIIRNGSTYKVQYFQKGTDEWIQMRMFHLFDENEIKVGLYACSPKEAPFVAKFNYLKINETNSIQ